MVEPAMRPLHDIACPPQAAAMRAAAHRQQRPDAPGQDQRDRPGEAVAPIPLQHRGTAAPAVAQDRPQPPQQARQRLLIPSVGRPRLRHQREPLAVRDEMPFTALFGPIRGVGAHVGAAAHRPLRTAVDDGALQVEQALFPQRGHQGHVGRLPHAGGGPLVEASPAGAARAPAQRDRQGLPTQALAEYKDDAIQAEAIRDAASPALGRRRMHGQPRGDGIPQRIVHKRIHGRVSLNSCTLTAAIGTRPGF